MCRCVIQAVKVKICKKKVLSISVWKLSKYCTKKQIYQQLSHIMVFTKKYFNVYANKDENIILNILIVSFSETFFALY